MEELARDSLRSSVSSPGMPKTYRTPSASRHSTNRSEALTAMISRYLTASLLVLALGAPPAQAASELYITGGGDGHGIGMSQYGAYGYALHGWTYRQILAHYYQGTAIGSTDPSQIIRALIAVGNPSFSGASSAAGVNGHTTQLSSSQNYSVRNATKGQLNIYNQSGARVATFNPPLSVSGSGPV